MRYQKLIYTIARRGGLDETSASDIFQNVFAALIEKLDGIEQPERIQAWLVTTARRETWRAIAGEKDSHFATPETQGGLMEALEVADTAPLADEVLYRLESQHRIRLAVGSLDERCRKMITLLFLGPDPMPYSEVAKALAIPEGSIGPTRARCLQKLLRLLEKSKL